jgi:hypothetical protein
MKNYGTLYENNARLTIASGVLQAFGMWFFVLAIGVFVVVNPNDFTFGLLSSFGLCAVAAICFRLSDKWR